MLCRPGVTPGLLETIMTTLKSVLLALVAIAAAGTPAPASETPKGDPVKLIEKLNSDDFDARDAAARELAAIGESARPALEKAFAAGDPDTKEAVQAILARMSQSVLMVQACDRDGKPLPDTQADAQIYEASDIYNRQQNMQSVTTTADGTVQLPPCKPGVYQCYFTWKKAQPAGSNYFGGQFKLLEGKNRMLCTLSLGGTLQIPITGEDGKPIKDAKVTTINSYYSGSDLDAEALTMLAQQSGRQDVKSGDSNENGIAKLENVPQGVCQCLVTHENFESAATPLYRVHDGQTTEGAAIKLKPKTLGKLQLILVKDDGKPLAKTSIQVTLKKHVDNADEKKSARAAMQARMWFGGFGQQGGEQTDDAGKLLKENVAAGTYRLTIQTGDANGRFVRGHGRSQNDMMQYVSEEVVVKTGETTEVTLKPLTGSTLTGKILTDQGAGVAYATVIAIPEADYISAGSDAMNQYARYNYGNGSSEMRYEQTGTDGAYKFTRLKPGRYVLTVQSQSGESAIVYGVEVAEGKDTAAPDVKFAAPAKVFKEVKVHVSLPDGRPAAGATINVATVNRGGGWSSSGSQTDADGNMKHSINNYTASLPNKVSISLAGYRPVNLDLNSPEIKPEDISITLQLRNFQKLCVKTVDEAGKPVAGVQIWPVGKDSVYRHRYNANDNPTSRMKRTDKEGQVHFDGLIDGKRTIRVETEGYFADESSLAVNIAPEGETQHTVVLHKGLTLSGKVALPEGVAPEQANAVLSQAQGVVVRKMVNANGEFQFTGLEPGECTVSAEAPGCQLGCEYKRVTLAKDKPAEAVTIPMIHAGGAAVRLGVERSGMHAALFPPDFWKDPDHSKYWAHQSAYDTVDGQGRAEFWAPPGPYMVSLTPNQMRANYDAQFGISTTTLTALAGPITVQPFKSSAEMATLKGDEIQIPTTTASFTLTIIPEYPAGIAKEKFARSYVALMVVGQRATGSINVTQRNYRNNNNEEIKPVIIGTPPPGLKAPVDTNVTTVTGVPEGDYKIYAQTAQKKGEPKQPMKPLLEFSIKDGETKSLGELKVAIPAPSKEELEQQDYQYQWWAAQEDDKVDNFKP